MYEKHSRNKTSN